MKAEDLRLGNLLLIDGQVTEVWGLDLDGVNGLADRYDSMVTNYPKTVEPIPLTEEWLKRLGFERDNSTMSVLFNFSICLDRRGNELYLTMTDWPNDEKRIEYVHQVQNLVFALTGQELEVKTIA